MADVKDLKIRYTGDVSGVKKATDDIDKMHTGLASKLNSVGQKMTSVGKAATVGLTLPLVGFGISAVKNFGEAEQAAAQTAAVLKSTGGAAGVTEQQVGKLATRLGNLSVQDDDAIRAGENLLLTFTNIRNEAGKGNDIFNQTTAIMTDVAAAMGQEPKDAAIQLGKALNDPAKGLTALTRIGVTFSDEQRKQVEHMTKVGDTAGAQRVILAELTKEFGGSAKAMGKSATPGERLSVTLGNLSETVGQFLVPMLEQGTKWIQKVATWFENLSPSAQGVVVKIGVVVAAIGPLLIVFGKLTSALGSIIPILAKIGSVMMANPWILLIAATVALVVVIVKNWSTIKAFLLKIWHALEAAWIAVWHRIRGVVLPIVHVITAYIRINVAIWKVILKTVWAVVKAVFSAIWGTVKVVWHAITTVIRVEWAIWRGIFNVVKSVVVGVWHAIRDAAVTVWHGVTSVVRNAWDGLVGIIKGAANIVIGIINTIIRGINTVITGANHLPGPDLPTISEIPRLATGGVVQRGGLAWVGERGPELVDLPRGARVHPNGGGGTVVVNVYGSVLSERDLADVVQRALLRKRQRNGVLGLS